MEKGKLLFISYYFPPIQSVAVLRNYYFALSLSNHFSKTVVLTTSNRTLFPKQEFPLSSFDIQIIPTFDYRTLLYYLSSSKNLHHTEESKRHPFIQFFLKLNDTLPFSLFIGEGGLLYIIYAYFQASAIIRKQGSTHCFSSFRVAGNHIVSSLLKRKFPDLIWIADFHDLPYDSLRKNAFFPNLQSWFWKRILKNANKVITVSHGLANTLQKWHPNVEVIRDGIVERKALMEVDRESFIINYTGSIYRGVQNADSLWTVLKELTEKNSSFSKFLKIRYAGKDSSLFTEWLKKFNLDNYLEDKGLVSREQAMEFQETASINLLLTWSFGDSKGIVTGKVYEYLSARRPILLLINGEQDEEMETWFKEMECGEVFYNEPDFKDSPLCFLTAYFDKWLLNVESSPPIFNFWTWQNQAQKIMKDA